MPIIKKLKRHLEEFVSSELTPLSDQGLKPGPHPYAHLRSQGLEKNNSDRSSFEETYKTSYSHGLEQIYALETVDVKSIRVLGSSSEKENLQIEPLVDYSDFDLENQLEFPFKEGQSSLDSFLLNEPLSVLGFSKHTENNLRRLEKNRIKDLLKIDLRSLTHVKGMGQGHIDEIRERLNQYIAGKPLYGCKFIDFESWVKTLLPENEKKKVFIVLDYFDLSHLISLSPFESVELRKLTVEKKQEWLEDGLDGFRTDEKKRYFEDTFKHVLESLIVPWMRQRQGMVYGYELEERFEKLSLNRSSFKKAWAFFQKIYQEKGNLIDSFLPNSKGLYFADRKIHENFERVNQKTLSYFYSQEAEYPLNQLVDYILKEFACRWEGFKEGFVAKAIRSSPNLEFKKEKGILLSYLK